MIADTGTWIRHDMTTNGMNKERMQGDCFANERTRNTCEEIVLRVDEQGIHARRFFREWTNTWSMPNYKQRRNLYIQHQANTKTNEDFAHLAMQR